MTTLDNLRKHAKRWLNALRDGDSDARARLTRAYRSAPAAPGLRDVQHALARERGHDSWKSLIEATRRQTREPSLIDRVGGPTDAARVATFLGFACWDHHTHGKGDHRMHDRAAQRLVAHHPEIARGSLYTAIVCGEIDEVRHLVATRPDAAREPGGPRGWTPILYLAFTRFTFSPTIEHAVEIARVLLDHGANPNDYYMAGDARYSVLTGIAGEGEQDSPRQPYAATLFQLLLERGAEPFDIQVVYDTHFSGDMEWWLELVHAHTMTTDRRAAWDDADWPMFDMGGYGSGARFLLDTALKTRNLRLAHWVLAHGANPNSAPARDPRFPKHSLYEEAVRAGLPEMVDLLARYGATPRLPVLDEEEQFLEACLRLDHEAARAHLQQHPEYLQSSGAMFAAAMRDLPDALALLLDLGVALDIEDRQKTRALHHAVAAGARRSVQFLIERGAEVDPRDASHNNTPMGWAAHFDNRAMLDLLSQYSRDVWHLAFCGYVDRLREVLRAEPDLARQVTPDGITPLWWLPDDEAKAMEIVDMLLAAGADPAVKSREGRTAMDWALERGMVDVARLIAMERAERPAPSPDLERVERLARDMLIAHESGEPAALRTVQEHYGRPFTWDQLRDHLRQCRTTILGKAPGTSFMDLNDVRLLLAREQGFEDWAALVKASGRDG